MFNDIDLSKMGEMLNSVKQKFEEFETQAANKNYTTKAGGGLISITIDGNAQIQDISIDDELLNDKQSLQILLISAVNEAYELVKEEKKKQAAQAFGLSGYEF